MTDREVFEVKKGDTVYIAGMYSVGPFHSERYVPVLFECNVMCIRKDGTIQYHVVQATAAGEKQEFKGYSPRATRECYPPASYFERTPYGAMAALHNANLAAVKHAREKLAKAEVELALVAADPLLASGFNENQILADAMDLPRERECVKCENTLPVCCDTEDGPYCQTCCPCDHRKAGGIGGGDYQRTDVEV